MSLTRDILNSPALTSFLNHLTECGKSQSTEDEYSQQKKRFIAFSIYLPNQQVGFYDRNPRQNPCLDFLRQIGAMPSGYGTTT